MELVRPFLVAIVLVQLVAVSVVAEPGKEFLLTGQVFELEGQGAGSVEILLQPLNGGTARTAATNSSGHFSLRAPAGVYTLQIGAPPVWQRTLLLSHRTILPPLHLAPDLPQSDVNASRGWTEVPPENRPLQTAGETRGRVLESRALASGDPLPESWVWIEGYDELVGKTDLLGGYRLPVPVDPGNHLRVAKEGYLTARVPVPHADPGEVVRGWTVRLLPASFLRGQVHDVEGRPLAARLKIESVDPDQRQGEVVDPGLRVGFTDPSGQFFLPTPPEEEIDLLVDATGFTDVRLRLKAPKAGETSPLIDIELQPTFRARGDVRDQDGKPVPGALVTPVPWGDDQSVMALLALRSGEDQAHDGVKSDGKGRFLLEDLPAGRYSLVVTAESYEPVAVAGLHVPESDETVPLGTIFLAPAASLTGRVVDETGQPVEGAGIRIGLLGPLGRSSTGRGGDPVRTDESGEFVVGGLAQGSRVEVIARREGYLVARLPAVDVPSDAPVTLVMKQSGAVTGRVTDADGRPVVGAVVQARPQGQRGSSLRHSRLLSGEASGVRTDEEGVYRLREVEPGPVVVNVRADCCLPTTKTVEVKTGAAPQVVDFRLPEGSVLTGFVYDAQGQPVAGAAITAGVQGTRSDGKGGFRVEGLREGPLTLSVRHPGNGRTEQTVDVGRQRRVEIRFEEPGRVTGRVITADQEPVADGDLRVRCAGDRIGRPVRTDISGRFQEIAQPGPCRVTARAPGFAPSTEHKVDLQPGRTADVEIILGDGISLQGRILGAEAFALARSQILASAAGSPAITGRIDPAGNFEFLGLEPGDWRVTATLPDGRRAATEVTIEAGQREAWVELEVDAGQSVEGRVTLDGSPLAGAWVTASTLKGIRLTHTLAGPNGEFRVNGLDKDAVQVDVTTPEGDLHWSGTVDVGPGAAVEVDIWTGELRGQVVEGKSSLGVAGARLVLEPLATSRWLATRSPPSGPRGDFGPWRLPVGRYRLTVNAPGFAPAVTEFVMEAGATLVVTVPLSPAPSTEGTSLEGLR